MELAERSAKDDRRPAFTRHPTKQKSDSNPTPLLNNKANERIFVHNYLNLEHNSILLTTTE